MNNSLKNMEELKQIIIFIRDKYDKISNEWENNSEYISLNMQKYQVKDIYNNDKILAYILNYRNFINEKATEIIDSIKLLNTTNIVICRVKALNSIQYKIENYEKNHENGKIPIRKCLNDLFGIRLISEEEITFETIKEFLNKNFPELKCIHSKKEQYDAVHIYFENDNNKKFQWELQLWDKFHEESNYISHAKHKQGYTKWESENI